MGQPKHRETESERRDQGTAWFDDRGRLKACDAAATALFHRATVGAGRPCGVPTSLAAFLAALHAAAVRPKRPPQVDGCRAQVTDYWLASGSVLTARLLPLPGIGNILTLNDSTREKQRSWTHRMLSSQSRVMVTAPDLHIALGRILRHLGRHIAAESGRLWLLNTDAAVLALTAAWQRNASRPPPTLADDGSDTRALGEDLAGAAWQSRQAQLAAAPPGSRLAVPMVAGDTLQGVFEFSFADSDRMAAAVAPWLMGFCSKLGHVVRWRRHEEREALSQRRFEDLLATAGEAIISIDRQCRIVMFNRHAAEVFDYDAAAVIGQPLDVLLPAINAMELNAMLDDVSADDDRGHSTRRRSEVIGRRKNGSEFPAETVLSRFGVGDEMLLTVLLRDVSEQHRAEAALRKSERYSRMMFEESAFGMAVSAMDGRLRDVNPAMAKILGRSIEECLTLNYATLSPSQFIPANNRYFRQLLATGRFGPFETELLNNLGTPVPVRMAGVMLDQDGERLVWTIAEDISERRQARQALAIRDKAIASALTPIAMADLDGHLTYVNRAFLLLWGYGHEREVLGRSAVRFWINRRAAKTIGAELLATGRWIGEMAARRRDGDPRHIRVSANLVTDASGAPLCLMASFVDMTSHKASEMALRQAKDEAEIASRSKSEFLAAMSHELRTPLNAIIGFSELMRLETMGPVTNPRYREYLADIYESGVHLLGIINDILDISRVEAGRMTVHEESIQVPQAVQACLRMVRERAATAGLELQTRLASDIPDLTADPRLFKQILLNLLSNAVKFTPSGGSITVAATVEENGDFVLAVADTGIGMEEHQIAIALRPFAQLDSSLSRRFPGSGLGLPLAESFARLHGGSLVLQSAPGQGTTATLRLPGKATKSAT